MRIYQQIHNSPAFRDGQVGVYVQVLKTGRIVYSENALKPMIPASNLKVVTTAAAIDLLGPDFHYFTELRGGPVEQGHIRGNLYLRGQGDPTLCLPYVNPTSPWSFFAKNLKEKGVSSIEGDLVGDDSAFDREYLGKGWFDRYLLDSYAAPVGALSLNCNVVELTITEDAVKTEPASSGFRYQRQFKNGSYNECWLTRDRNSDVTVIHGSPGPGSSIKRTVTVADPGTYTLGSLANILKSNNINLAGKVRLINPGSEIAQSASAAVIARYQSPRMKDIIAQVNKESDNVFAQHVFKTLGHKSRGYGTAANGKAAISDFLRKHNIDDKGLVMVDGSGLSTLDRITPRQLVGVVDIMWRHRHGQIYVDSLPTGGEGTLTSRLGGLTLRAKTGTLDEHSALTGYLVSAYGQTLGFSILVNNVPQTWYGVELEDKILHTLAAWDQPL